MAEEVIDLRNDVDGYRFRSALLVRFGQCSTMIVPNSHLTQGPDGCMVLVEFRNSEPLRTGRADVLHENDPSKGDA